MAENEAKLNAELKAEIIRPVYLLYGDETFLTKTYAERIAQKALGGDDSDFNLVRLSDNPRSSTLSEYVESLPVFSDRKVILVNDFLPEKLDDKELEAYLDIISNMPDSCVLIFYLTSVKLSMKYAASKKIQAAIKEKGFVCEFEQLTPMKIAELITRKVNKLKRSISRTDAEYIAEITLCDLTLASEETGKLCMYVPENAVITREIIDKLVVKRLDTSIYALSDAIAGKNSAKAFKILDEYYEQRMDDISIAGALAGAFIDYYRAKIAKDKGETPQNAAIAFGFKPNRYFVMTKAYTAVSRLDLPFIRSCVQELSRLDVKLKSSSSNKRTLIEQTIIKLMVAK